MMDSAVAHFALDSGWAVRSGNSARKLSTGVPLLMVLTLGICELAGCAGADNDVTTSSRRLFRQSNSRPKRERKSTPMSG
jgi:hypothetical protein